MRHAHGGVGGVHTLAARTACMVNIHADVARVNLNLNVVRQNGDNLNASKGGLTSLFVVGGRNAHQTVYACLSTQHAKGIFALNSKGCAVNANNFGCRTIVDGDLPSATCAVLHIHLEEHEGPVLGLQATLTRLDAHNSVAVVKLTRKPAGEFHLVDLMFKLAGSLRSLSNQILVAAHLGGKLEGCTCISKA